MRWFIPSWNGDIRAQRDPDNADKTQLVIHEPTAHELQLLGQFAVHFQQKRWCAASTMLFDPNGAKRQTVTLNARLEKVAPLIASGYKAGKQTLTAIQFADGKVEIIEGDSVHELEEAATAAAKVEAPAAPVAATVKRPTPCCPQCHPMPIEPAEEVLREFLTPTQLASWERERVIMIRGGLSRHRYLLSDRRGPFAAHWGKICFDLDDQWPLHFHDHTIPGPEEVLATKLILEHREEWLRNEATTFFPTRVKFKNPFGGGGDGVRDSSWTAQFGREMANLFPQDFARFAANLPR